MTLAVFLAALGAALRLTRLGVEDTITQPFRTWLALRSDAEKYPRTAAIGMWFVGLFECPWCLGMWVSAAVTALAVVSDGRGWFLYPALALSISYLIGAISTVVVTIEEI